MSIKFLQQLTLGKFISEIKKAMAHGAKTIALESTLGSVRNPGRFFSYRGNYYDLAFDAKYSTTPLAIEDFLADLEEQVDSIHEGYKGGEFLMNEDVLVWLAEYGSGGGEKVVDVGVHETAAIIYTI